MKWEVELNISGTSSILVEANTADEAREIAENLRVEVDIFLPPESVDDSGFDRIADCEVRGVFEYDEPIRDLEQ